MFKMIHSMLSPKNKLKLDRSPRLLPQHRTKLEHHKRNHTQPRRKQGQ